MREERSIATTCPRHPAVETELTCGRCGEPICPYCMVHTPGGIRCPDCARLRRPPMYELSARDHAIAAGTALALGLVLGAVGGFILPPGIRGSLFGLVIGLLAGVGSGALMAGALSRATRNKRGLAMQVIAAGGLLIAYALRALIGGVLDPEFLVRDTVGGLALLAAIVSAWGRLR